MNPTLYVILLLIIVAVPVLLVFDGRNVRRGSAYILARKIFDRSVRLFETEGAKYREASLAEYPNLDAGFYERTARELEAQGFQTLGDIENMSLAEVSGVQTFMRVMVDKTRTTVAYCADLLGPKSKRSTKLIDFTTEFSDGRFLGTNNAVKANSFFRPPQVDVQCVTDPVSATELLNIHRKRIDEFRSQDSEITTKVFNTIQDVIQGWKRSRALRVAFRKTLSTEELRKEFKQTLNLKKRDPLLVAAVSEEYEKLYKQHRAKG